MKSGVISSTADASKNHFDTGKLIAESQENHSKWDATSTGGGLNLGTGALGSSLGPLGVIAGNLAQNSGLISGGQRKHDETSTSQSAISGNINVNAGSTEGSYTTDVDGANGHLENKFDADKLANQLQYSQLGMQLVGEIMGKISDKLYENNVQGFGEGGFGRLGLEAAGNAIIASVTGGDAGMAAASTATSGLVSAQTRLLAQEIAKQMSDNPEMQVLIANALSNAVAGGTGALTDLAMGGSGLNGSVLGAMMQAYNQANDPNGGKVDETTQKIIQNLYDWVEAASYFPIIGDPASLALALMYAANGDYNNASLNLAAAAIGIFVAGEGKLIVKGGILTAEEAEKLLAGKENNTYHTITVDDNGKVTEYHTPANEANHGQVDGKTTVGTSEASNINMDHILDGEVKTNKSGTKRSSGGHLLDNPDIKVTEWTGAADKNGVSSGYISVRNPATGEWVPKQARTTFFPESWDKSRAASEIESAFANAEPTGKPNQWQGTSSSGMRIEGYYNKDGSAATAYPVYTGVKK